MFPSNRAVTIGIVFLISSIQALWVGAPLAAQGTLDGLRFQGQTGEQGKGDHHEDVITFDKGLFRSLDCENWGFGPAPYTVKQDGGVYHFSATLRSEDRGTLAWRGTIRGDAAEASFRWLHERWYWTIDRQYWFKGIRQSDQ